MTAWLANLRALVSGIDPVSWFLVLVVYLVPIVIVVRRRTSNLRWIILLDIFLGWTVFGWIAALVWSIADVRAPAATRRCPSCNRAVPVKAPKCRFCGAVVPPVAAPNQSAPPRAGG